MAKIRHIAYRAEDPEAMARFFIEAFEMKIAERRARGAIDLTDGTINITLLPVGLGDPKRVKGIEHIGFTAADNDAAKQRVLAAGAKESAQLRFDDTHYEEKFVGPEGIIVDVGHWAGTAAVDEHDEKAEETRV